MYEFLAPQLLGFVFNSTSAFTTFFSHRLGERGGRVVCIILRDVLGIPLWVIGYIMAAKTPSTLLFKPGVLSSTISWIFILAGVSIIITGLMTLRWRAAAPSVKDTLVEQGVYAHIRHPLYSGMILELTGLFLWLPTMPVLVACILGIIWVMVQARLEEIDLVKRLPEYKDYMLKVPRFIPKIKFYIP
jgi:protein-S-isoprenylcysteine O-methyltransferase Ste14